MSNKRVSRGSRARSTEQKKAPGKESRAKTGKGSPRAKRGSSEQTKKTGKRSFFSKFFGDVTKGRAKSKIQDVLTKAAKKAGIKSKERVELIPGLKVNKEFLAKKAGPQLAKELEAQMDLLHDIYAEVFRDKEFVDKLGAFVRSVDFSEVITAERRDKLAKTLIDSMAGAINKEVPQTRKEKAIQDFGNALVGALKKEAVQEKLIKLLKGLPSLREKLSNVNLENILALRPVLDSIIGELRSSISDNLIGSIVKEFGAGFLDAKGEIKEDPQAEIKFKQSVIKAFAESIGSKELKDGSKGALIRGLLNAFAESLQKDPVRAKIKEALKAILPSADKVIAEIEKIEDKLGKDLVAELVKENGILQFLRGQIGDETIQGLVETIGNDLLLKNTKEIESSLIEGIWAALTEKSTENQKGKLIQSLLSGFKNMLKRDGVQAHLKDVLLKLCPEAATPLQLLDNISKDAQGNLINELLDNEAFINQLRIELKNNSDLMVVLEELKAQGIDILKSKNGPEELRGSLVKLYKGETNLEAKDKLLKGLLAALSNTLKNEVVATNIQNRASVWMYSAGKALDIYEKQTVPFWQRIKEKLKMAFTFGILFSLSAAARKKKIEKLIAKRMPKIPGLTKEEQGKFATDMIGKILYTGEYTNSKMMRGLLASFIAGNVGISKGFANWLLGFVGRKFLDIKPQKQTSLETTIKSAKFTPAALPGSLTASNIITATMAKTKTTPAA